jgi:hypothetical protein
MLENLVFYTVYTPLFKINDGDLRLNMSFGFLMKLQDYISAPATLSMANPPLSHYELSWRMHGLSGFTSCSGEGKVSASNEPKFFSQPDLAN